MRISQFFISTLRDDPTEAEVISHKLMIRGGYIRKLASGIYSYLPLGLKVLQKIEKIVREEMVAVGACELLMPMVLPADLWRESGRWDIYGKELLRFKDRHENEFCLGPTHEEIITDIVRKEVKSYRQLPLSLFQIQTKFRDEIRPRFGLMRGREFIMKDCYSFDRNEEQAQKNYWRYFETYKKIFNRCGLGFKAVEALTGVIGGSLSHEFQVLAESGEDAIVSCSQCDYAANMEKADVQLGETCKRCGKGAIASYRGIEVGQVFYLGDKYSKALKVFYLDEKGQKQIIQMGCYGIGIGRTAAAAIEQNHDAQGICWPLGIAPFEVVLITLSTDSPLLETASKLYQTLKDQKVDILWDDRDERAGVKFNDMDLIGIPYQIIVGAKGLDKGEVELKNRKTGKKEFILLKEVVSKISTILCSLIL